MITPALGHQLRSGEVYDPTTCLALAEHAQAVYAAGDLYWQDCLDGGYDQAVTAISGATQIGLAFAPWGSVLSARGTHERWDIYEDLMLWRVAWRDYLPAGARVHYGFLRQARRIAKAVVDRVRAAWRYFGRDPIGTPLFVCGHSLGAPVAMLAGLLLERELGYRIAAVYTFESPRVGNRAWAEWWDATYGERTHRVVRFRSGVPDLVTRLPPAGLGYWHCGRPSLISHGQRWTHRSDWDDYVAEHKLPLLARWRVLSRLRAGVLAHGSQDLVDELRVIRGRTMEAPAPVAMEVL
jgi:hypothetical protein